ncbi:MAG: hypothetical protein RR482_11050 [Clostridia bacterium]
MARVLLAMLLLCISLFVVIPDRISQSGLEEATVWQEYTVLSCAMQAKIFKPSPRRVRAPLPMDREVLLAQCVLLLLLLLLIRASFCVMQKPHSLFSPLHSIQRAPPYVLF